MYAPSVLKLQILQATPSPQLLQSIAEDVSLLPDIAEHVRSSPSAALALSADLATATPAQLTQIIRDLAPQMKNRRDRPSAFLKIDLPDFIATHGYISVGEGGHQVLIEEYKRRVDARVLEIVEKHPAITALREGREVTDDQLVDLERTLHRELGRDDIQLSSRNIRIAYGLRVDNFLAFLRHLLALDTIPDYPQVVQRGFERHIQAHNYNAEQIRFLRSVQEVFLAKRTLVGQRFRNEIMQELPNPNAATRAPRKIGASLHGANQIQGSHALSAGGWNGTAWFFRFEPTL